MLYIRESEHIMGLHWGDEPKEWQKVKPTTDSGYHSPTFNFHVGFDWETFFRRLGCGFMIVFVLLLGGVTSYVFITNNTHQATVTGIILDGHINGLDPNDQGKFEYNCTIQLDNGGEETMSIQYTALRPDQSAQQVYENCLKNKGKRVTLDVQGEYNPPAGLSRNILRITPIESRSSRNCRASYRCPVLLFTSFI